MSKKIVLDFNTNPNLIQFAFKNLQEAVFWVNAHGDILYVNDTLCAMSGYSQKELMTMNVRDILPPNIAPYDNALKCLSITYEVKSLALRYKSNIVN